MARWVYCATAGAVDAASTASLLRSHRAIWFPVVYNNARPAAGDELFLVWRDAENGPLLLLGHGLVLPRQGSPDTVWSEAQYAGIRDAARNLGYGGPTNMGFLVLDQVIVYPDSNRPTMVLEQDIQAGLNAL